MYECIDCGRRFEEPRSCYGDTYEFWGVTKTEIYLGCPYCGSAEIERTEETDDYDKDCQEQ